jgi:hypothetical protein
MVGLPTILLLWLQTCSAYYGVDPYFAMAVAHVESSTKSQEFRIGKMGRTFYGPMGIHKCFKTKWDISNPYVNIQVGVRALRGNQRRALRRYNPKATPTYESAVFAAKRRYERKKVFDGLKGGD